MSIEKSTKLFFGSVLVYVTMASCVASERTTMSESATAGASGGGGSMMTGNGGMGGILDPVPDASADPSISGSRLKHRYYAGDDGSKKTFGQLYDTKRHELCYFAIAEDSKTRCIPQGATAFYEDAQCTMVIASPTYGLQQCADQYKYVHVLDQYTCNGPGPAIHEFGSPVAVPFAYFKKTDGTCATFNIGVIDWHRLGAKVLPSEFVAATVETEL